MGQCATVQVSRSVIPANESNVSVLNGQEEEEEDDPCEGCLCEGCKCCVKLASCLPFA